MAPVTQGALTRGALAVHPSRRVWRLGRTARVWLLVGAMWIAATAVYDLLLRGDSAASPRTLPWWGLAIMYYLAEANVVHVHFRKEAHSLSLSEIPLVAGLFFTPPSQIVLAVVVGSAAALLVHRRQPPVKFAFNLAAFALNTSVGILVFEAAKGGGSLRLWLAGFAAVIAESIVGVLLVSLAIFLAEGSSTMREVPRLAAIAVTGAVAVASLGMLGAKEFSESGLPVLLLLVVPAVTVFIAYRGYGRQRQRHEHLRFLFETMQATQAAQDGEEAVRQLLCSARTIFRADVAELLLLSQERERVLRSAITPDGTWLMQATELQQEQDAAVRDIIRVGDIRLFERALLRRSGHPYLRARGLKDAMVAPLRRDGAVVAVLTVGDHSSDVSTFVHDDRQLFEAFAAHAAVLLENDRLVQSVAALTELKEKLRHQADHDALTGLPNRRLILELATEALAARETGSTGPAILFVDLDDFKTVNDSLGHSAGDELLVGFGKRLREALGSTGTAARLGGDEFAVLLPDVSRTEAKAAALRLLRRFEPPLSVARRMLPVRATIGIGLTGTHVRDAEDLLRNADLAMYHATRARGQGYAVYRPEMRVRVMERHDLVGALERALEAGEIVPHFQPIVELGSGRLKAFEALARWAVPAAPTLLPDQFLHVAEETGLIVPIGRTVLRQSLEQLRRWQVELRLPQDVSVSVNLSARELRDPLLPGQVATMLREAGLSPSSLILELTESSAMTDVETTAVTMDQLRRIGVKLALDDFGTGYSSLSRLSGLPIDLIKIGRPFTDDLRDDDFARAIFSFAGSLPLAVVAEGIETNEQVQWLREFRCDWVQGYLYARPLSPADAEQFVAAQPESRRAALRAVA